MRMLSGLLLMLGALAGCSAETRLASAGGFSFADYGSVVIAKPDAHSTHASHYGLEVELANRLARYGLDALGEKSFADLSPEAQRRVLFLRMHVTGSDGKIIISASFDEAVTGRTVCSLTASDEGDVLDVADQREVFQSLSDEVIEKLARDKGLEVTDD
jgi:hypothetical protein